MKSSTSKKSIWIGWAMSILAILFLTMDAVMKLIKPEPIIKATVELGYPESTIVTMGLLLLFFTIIYSIPKTAIFGAILLTGYLGGAVATHFRLLHHVLGETLFPVYIAIFIWGGLVLRKVELKNIFIGKHKKNSL